MSNRLRFTDEYPPPEFLDNYPNWVLAYEEGRAGQHEGTIKPGTWQRTLADDVVLTAADVWFPNDNVYPGLIRLRDFEPEGLVVYENELIWRLDFDGKGTCRPEKAVSLQDGNRFPLRFISRLPESKKLGPIRRLISGDGRISEWTEDE